MPGFKTLTGMTGTGSAVELAEMLRQMGRGRDTVLAHITPEEAQMLKDMGGSGTINPDTGLPEFLDIYGGDFGAEPAYDVEAQPEGFYGQTPTATFNPETQETRLYRDSIFNAQPEQGSFENFYRQNLRGTVTPSEAGPQFAPPPFAGDAESQFGGFYGGRAPSPEEFARVQAALAPQQGFLERGAQAVEDTATKARELATRYPTVARLLSTGATSLPALLNASRARREADRRAEELRRLGAPLREQGEALRQRALAGQLTPQQAAAQEAERARQRQAAASRGVTAGTQAQMIENQLARQRAQLSETNLNNAIKLLNLGNAYDEEAIRMKIAGDQRVSNTLANIFANLGQQAAATQTQPQSPQGQETRVTRRPDVRQA